MIMLLAWRILVPLAVVAVVAAVRMRNVVVVVNANINDRKPTYDLTFSDLDKELREYAISHDVPIIQDDGLAMLESIIRIKRPKKI